MEVSGRASPGRVVCCTRCSEQLLENTCPSSALLWALLFLSCRSAAATQQGDHIRARERIFEANLADLQGSVLSQVILSVCDGRCTVSVTGLCNTKWLERSSLISSRSELAQRRLQRRGWMFSQTAPEEFARVFDRAVFLGGPAVASHVEGCV